MEVKNGAAVLIENSLFDSNTGSTGGAVNVDTGSGIIIQVLHSFHHFILFFLACMRSIICVQCTQTLLQAASHSPNLSCLLTHYFFYTYPPELGASHNKLSPVCSMLGNLCHRCILDKDPAVLKCQQAAPVGCTQPLWCLTILLGVLCSTATSQETMRPTVREELWLCQPTAPPASATQPSSAMLQPEEPASTSSPHQ